MKALLWLVLCVTASACSFQMPTPPQNAGLELAPVVPVSMERHLLVARHCQRIGETSNAWSKGNLVLAFVGQVQSSTYSQNGIGSTTVQSGFRGFDYECPPEILERMGLSPEGSGGAATASAKQDDRGVDAVAPFIRFSESRNTEFELELLRTFVPRQTTEAEVVERFGAPSARTTIPDSGRGCVSMLLWTRNEESMAVTFDREQKLCEITVGHP